MPVSVIELSGSAGPKYARMRLHGPLWAFLYSYHLYIEIAEVFELQSGRFHKPDNHPGFPFSLSSILLQSEVSSV